MSLRTWNFSNGGSILGRFETQISQNRHSIVCVKVRASCLEYLRYITLPTVEKVPQQNYTSFVDVFAYLSYQRFSLCIFISANAFIIHNSSIIRGYGISWGTFVPSWTGTFLQIVTFTWVGNGGWVTCRF